MGSPQLLIGVGGHFRMARCLVVRRVLKAEPHKGAAERGIALQRIGTCRFSRGKHVVCQLVVTLSCEGAQ